MEKDLQALETQVEQLERNHGVLGAFNPETTKVLEFRESPDRVEFSIRNATLDRLRTENTDLLRRISELEGRAVAGAAAVELVPRSSLATLLADLEAAKAAVKQKETMLKRISQVSVNKHRSSPARVTLCLSD
jgi:BMFP domain-containing protein YqiC